MKVNILLLALVSKSIALPPDFRIYGGSKANINDFPYQVAVLRPCDECGCGGSILSNEWILTAAHCIKSYKISEISIRAGSSHFSKGGSTKSIKSAHFHPSYKESTSSYDFCLLHLKEPLKFSKSIQSIDLPNQGQVFKSGSAWISGWGENESSKFSEQLYAVEVSLVSIEKCSKAYSGNIDTKSMICAGGKEKDACNHDSGGPLALRSGPKTVLIGVVTKGEKCGMNSKNIPGIYGNVAQVRNWIKKVSGI